MKPDHKQPEMEFAESFIQHASSDFRVPVIKCTEEGEQNSADDHVMKMRDDEIRTAKLPVERRGGQHNACKPGNQELEQEPDAEQHGRLEYNASAPHRAKPVKDLDSGGHTDNHRGDCKEAVCVGVHPDGEHVVRPYTHAYKPDAHGGAHHNRVSENRFPGKYRNDF